MHYYFASKQHQNPERAKQRTKMNKNDAEQDKRTKDEDKEEEEEIMEAVKRRTRSKLEYHDGRGIKRGTRDKGRR